MTRLLVLGLLDEGLMSGYDIQQKIRQADAERWGGVLPGSIYHALAKLEREGYIQLAGMEHRGHRQKAVYQITDQGRAYLPGLVEEALRTPDVRYPTDLYSGLSLLDRLPREQARRALEEQRTRLEEEYRALEQGERKNREAGQEVPLLSRLTIHNMFAVLQLQRQFVDGLLAALEDEV